jgi:hypothetical protein
MKNLLGFSKKIVQPAVAGIKSAPIGSAGVGWTYRSVGCTYPVKGKQKKRTTSAPPMSSELIKNKGVNSNEKLQNRR